MYSTIGRDWNRLPRHEVCASKNGSCKVINDGTIFFDSFRYPRDANGMHGNEQDLVIIQSYLAPTAGIRTVMF